MVQETCIVSVKMVFCGSTLVEPFQSLFKDSLLKLKSYTKLKLLQEAVFPWAVD